MRDEEGRTCAGEREREGRKGGLHRGELVQEI